VQAPSHVPLHRPSGSAGGPPAALPTHAQGLTLIQFLAHGKRFLWDRGCI